MVLAIIVLSFGYVELHRLSLMASKLQERPNDFGNGSMLLILRELLWCKEANINVYFCMSCNTNPPIPTASSLCIRPQCNYIKKAVIALTVL